MYQSLRKLDLIFSQRHKTALITLFHNELSQLYTPRDFKIHKADVTMVEKTNAKQPERADEHSPALPKKSIRKIS